MRQRFHPEMGETASRYIYRRTADARISNGQCNASPHGQGPCTGPCTTTTNLSVLTYGRHENMVPSCKILRGPRQKPGSSPHDTPPLAGLGKESGGLSLGLWRPRVASVAIPAPDHGGGTGTSEEGGYKEGSCDDFRGTELPNQALTRGIAKSQHHWAAVGTAAVSLRLLAKYPSSTGPAKASRQQVQQVGQVQPEDFDVTDSPGRGKARTRRRMGRRLAPAQEHR